MSDRAPAFESKICAPDYVVARLAELPRPLVFTNGVFDLLHRGHVSYLARARALGASLLVALNDDASARRLGKGVDRPINTLADRAAMLAALESTSLVTWFEQDTPLALIELVAPQVLVKGGDWPIENIVGARKVLSGNGQVLSIAIEHERSSSALLDKIRRVSPSADSGP